MHHRLVHVSFVFSGPWKVQELEPTFTAIGDDWIRYSAINWILWTSKPIPHIATLLEPHLLPPDQVLIATLGDEFFGRLQPWIFAWINQKRPDLPLLTQQQAARAAMLPASAFDPHNPQNY